ncbi:hypothetical protein BD779DRAFT_1577011, partial [Infundibulicybe gibba]
IHVVATSLSPPCDPLDMRPCRRDGAPRPHSRKSPQRAPMPTRWRPTPPLGSQTLTSTPVRVTSLHIQPYSCPPVACALSMPAVGRIPPSTRAYTSP